MVSPQTPMQALTTFLRTNGPKYVQGIAWGDYLSPFYQKAPEPSVPLPYLICNIPPSSVQHTQGKAAEGANYIETWKPHFKVVGLSPEVEAVSAPMVRGSAFWLLDALADAPSLLSCRGFFLCEQFTRDSYAVTTLDEERVDGMRRVWTAEAEYTMISQSAYPFLA